MTMRFLQDTFVCGRALLMLFFLSFCLVTTFANDNSPKNNVLNNELCDDFGNEYFVDFTCDNVTDGGEIEGDEVGYPSPIFDPTPILNVTLPSGGMGTIEYLWIKTIYNPALGTAQWEPIINSNSIDYDPLPMDISTWYRRCARRSGCLEYVAESNIVAKMVLPCDNVTAGGSINFDQTGCAPFNPSTFINLVSPSGGAGDLEYLWFMSTEDVPFSPTSPNWFEITGSDADNYTSSALTQTTYFIRCARRFECTEYTGESNIITIKIEYCCDNVTAGGMIGVDQEGCSPYEAATLFELVAASGGTGDLEYLWFWSTVDGPFSPTSPDWNELIGSNSFNYNPGTLIETTYFIRCSRRAGCIMYDGETNIVEIIVNPSPILNTEITAENACFGDATGAINLTITDGLAPFQINWDNGIGAVEDPQNLITGTYSVTVTGANTCTAETSVTIIQPDEIVLNLASTGTGCQGGTTGSAAANPMGGTGNYTYLWSDANIQTTMTATNLSVGSYSVTVTDENNCTSVGNVVVEAGANMVLTFEVQNELCLDENNGSATVNIANGTPPYTYQWDDALTQTTPTASNLEPGQYNITISDSAGCEETAAVEIGEGESVKPNLSVTPPSCFNGNDGTAFVDEIIGGTPDFTYQWNDANTQTTSIATGLSPGNYIVTVTDANGCSAVENILVENINPVVVALSGTNESCPDAADGTATVSLVNNATAPFTYLWSFQNQTTFSVENLPPDLYSTTVTDANGCTGVSSIQIMEGTGLDLNIFGTNEGCENAADGTATLVSISNGTPPFSYQWDDANSQTTEMATGLSAGTFQVIVTDAAGCTGSAGVILSAGTSLNLDISKTDILCGGDANGTATVISNNGTTPFTFLWNDTNTQTTATATSLGMGEYQVTVTDASGCSAIATTTITAPMDLDFSIQNMPVLCSNGETGTAEIIISNGNTNDYNFQWNDANNSTTATINGLSAGFYDVTITNADGCMDIGQVEIVGPAPFDITIMTASTSCSDSSNGSAIVTVEGGMPPYTYLWNDNNATASSFLTNASGGTYEVTITDNVGCTIVESVAIFAPSPLNLEFNSNPESCLGSLDGKASVNVSGGTSGYSYQWDDANNSTTLNVFGLENGTYSLTATDANSCTITGSVAVEINSTLAIEVNSTDLTCADANDGSAAVTITGGQPDFSIQWNDDGNSTTGTVSNLDVGFYNVTVTDAAGCTGTGTTDIFEPAPVEVSITKEDVICSNNTDGSATANVTGGTGIYFYQWNDANNQTLQTADNLPVGTYQVDVMDTNACLGTATVEIEFTSNLTAIATTENVTCNGDANGSVTANPEGGIAPYTVVWMAIGSGITINNLPTGTYSATVTDAVGCTAEVTATVTQPVEVICAAAVSAPIVNFGSANGELSVNPTGGNDTFTYEWNDGQTTQTATNLAAGTYAVTVMDTNGCSCVSDIELNNPSKIGDLVWEDDNENGVYESNEDGIAGITVTLTGTTATGVSINETTTTDNNGNYVFDNLENGEYQVHFELPNNNQFTSQNVGNEGIDSDANSMTGLTEPFQLGVGECNNDLDAGIFQLDEKVNIGNFVFFDSNRDGIQDNNEAGVNGITVRLYSVLTNIVEATQTTNFTGMYLFEDVTPGPYYIEFDPTTLPSNYVFTSQDMGGDDALDSDVDTLTGQTNVFEIFIFDTDDLTFDAGVYAKCDNVTQGGEITGNEDLCGIGADPSVIANLIDPSGGFGVFEYLWLQSSIPIYNGQGDPNWDMIPNSNAPFYNPGPITQTTYYIRCARRECCEDFPGESNIVVKTVKQVPLANIEPGQNIVCVDEDINYTATNAGFGSVYSWDFDTNADPATASTRVVNNVSWSTVGPRTVSLTVAKDDCSLTVTRNISVVDCPAPQGLVGFDDFYIENQENYLNLNWQMTQNLPSGLFYIQHSNDNETYETIGMMKNNIEEITYAFMDENPRRGENFYRIRFTPFEGERIYSNIEMSFLEMDDMRSINFYPNPFNERATIELTERQEVPVFVNLTSNYGQVIQTLEIPAGDKTAILKVDDLPNGMYFLQIIQEGRRDRVERIFKADR
jgi:hypothetical protein